VAADGSASMAAYQLPRTPAMRRLIKFLHSIGAIGMMGAMACLLVLLALLPEPMRLSDYARPPTRPGFAPLRCGRSEGTYGG
jgi:hypothetical protein